MKENNRIACEYLESIGGKPEGVSWHDLAIKFDIKNGNCLRNAWLRYKRTNKLVLKKETRDKDGVLINSTYGRQGVPVDVNLDEFEIIGGTTDSNGGPGWWRMLKKSDTDELSRLQKEVEEAHKEKYIEFKSKKKFETWIVIGCAHVPYHNKLIWKAFLKFIKSKKIDGIVIAGDFLDLKSISSHEQDKPFKLTLSEEYMEGYKCILDIQKASSKSKKVFLYGNHEDRYIRETSRLLGARYGEALISPEIGMNLKEIGYDVLTNWREDYVLLGNDLEIIHGYRLGKSALKSSLDDSAKNNRSLAFFHTHGFGTHTNGKFSAYNLGGFFDKNNISAFGYVGRNTRDQWTNGFGEVIVDKSGETFITPIRCGQNGFFADGRWWC